MKEVTDLIKLRKKLGGSELLDERIRYHSVHHESVVVQGKETLRGAVKSTREGILYPLLTELRKEIEELGDNDGVRVGIQMMIDCVEKMLATQ